MMYIYTVEILSHKVALYVSVGSGIKTDYFLQVQKP
jgi:hypothetical protein